MRIQVLICLIGLAFFAGCGMSGPQLAPVHGHVKLDGHPLENADVTFQPDDSKSPSYARTGADGHYELGYKRGVPGGSVGKGTVRIVVSREVVRNPPVIPARYNVNSDLVYEVKPGKNEIDFELRSDVN